MSKRAHILLVDDDQGILSILHETLDKDYEVSDVTHGIKALEILQGPEQQRPDLVLLDHHLKDMDGTEVQQKLLDNGIEIPVIFITGQARAQEVIKVSSRGAAGYITKPFTGDQVLEAVAQVLRQMELRREPSANLNLPELDPTEKIIGRGPQIVEIFRRVGLVAGTNHTVIITGETGTGKSMLAEVIHNMSERRRGPFVAFNCAGIPESLMESELFGSKKGAFTDAVERVGFLEAANKGTIFLDEIGDMTLSTQVKLLKVLDSHQIIRLGTTTPVKVDVRVIAATHRTLGRMVQDGRFRSDLYYRLNVFPIHMPSLRERREDIPALVVHILRQFPFRPAMPPAEISPEALEKLKEYHWPGNVRELMNVLQRAVIYSQGEIVMPEHIMFTESIELFSLDIESLVRQGAGLEELTFTTQKLAVHAALLQTNHNIPRAAEMLKISVEAFTHLRLQLDA